MGTLITISWRSLWRNRRRTLITVSAIGFALAFAVFVVAMGEGMYSRLVDQATRQQAGHVTLEHRGYRDAPAVDLAVARATELRRALGRLEGVSGTKALVLGQGIAKSGAGAVGVALMAVEPEIEAATSPLADRMVAGAFLAAGDQRQAIVGRALADRLKLSPGKKLVLASTDVSGALVEELVRVKGVFATGAEEVDGYLVQVPLTFGQQMLGLGADRVTQIGLLLEDPDDRAAVLAAARAVVADPDVAVLPWEEVIPDLASYITLDRGSNLVFQGILIFLSLFTIFNTILMSVLERTREFAVLLALGTSPWRLRAQVLTESLLVGLGGAALGLVVGGIPALAMQIYGLDMSALAGDNLSISGFAVDMRVHSELSAELLVGLGGLVVAAVGATSLLAMRRIGRIKIANVLR